MNLSRPEGYLETADDAFNEDSNLKVSKLKLDVCSDMLTLIWTVVTAEGFIFQAFLIEFHGRWTLCHEESWKGAAEQP